MTPSKYQLAIYAAVQSSSTNLMVRAVAGSGKTTTIEAASRLLPNTQRGLFLAFNKHIAETLKTRVPSNVEARTMNSLGWSVVRANCSRRVKLDAQKTENILWFDVMHKKNNRRLYEQKLAICRLVSLFKAHYLNVSEAQLRFDELADLHGIDCPDDGYFVSDLIETYRLSLNRFDVMDFDDQILFPLLNNWSFPQYDFIFVDEAQDLNPAQIEILVRMHKAGARVIAVGDPHQAIYGFRGADTAAMSTLKERLNMTELPLSVCYRCSRAVVFRAQRIVPEIEPAPNAPPGMVQKLDMPSLLEMVQDNDHILCRCTAPLVGLCLQLLSYGVPARVLGKDIGTKVLQLVERINCPLSMPISEFLYEADSYFTRRRLYLTEHKKYHELARLEDQMETLRVLCFSTHTVRELIEKLGTIFSDDKSGVILSTIHKAKGLEAPRVFLLRPDLLPHPRAETPWQLDQERNLSYVATTRARSTFFILEV